MKDFFETWKFRILIAVAVFLAGLLLYAAANGRLTAAPQELLSVAAEDRLHPLFFQGTAQLVIETLEALPVAGIKGQTYSVSNVPHGGMAEKDTVPRPAAVGNPLLFQKVNERDSAGVIAVEYRRLLGTVFGHL